MTWQRRTAAAADAGVEALTSQALRLLSQREHSALELRRKLLRDGDDAAVGAVVERLAESGLLSDERFAESYVRSRVERGQGPVKIRAGLLARGVADALIDSALGHLDEFWLQRARAALDKRFGDEAPADAHECGRRLRFLSQRGYPADVAYRAAAGTAAGVEERQPV